MLVEMDGGGVVMWGLLVRLGATAVLVVAVIVDVAAAREKHRYPGYSSTNVECCVASFGSDHDAERAFTLLDDALLNVPRNSEITTRLRWPSFGCPTLWKTTISKSPPPTMVTTGPGSMTVSR